MDSGSYEFWFLVLLGVAVVEMISSWSWMSWYFRYGLPVFRVQRPAGTHPRSLPGTGRLEEEFESGALQPLAFRAFAATKYGFREKAALSLRVSYTPVMHGVLMLEGLPPSVVVVGMANWWIVCFLAFLVAVSARQGWVDFAIFASILVAGIYVLQASRYRKVCDVTAKLLSDIDAG